MRAYEAMIEVLAEARRLAFRNELECAELDRAIARLRAGELALPGGLFLPTGPLQEIALDEGWGDAFLELADRYDGAALEIVENGPAQST